MIILKQKVINEYWFASTVDKCNIFKIVKYKQYKQEKRFGYINYDFYTKIVSLEEMEKDILDKFTKNTKYEINRAKREGVEFKIENNLDNFVEFYNNIIPQNVKTIFSKILFS